MRQLKFCENLQRIRREMGLSQKQLAEKLSTTVKTISHWETGYSEPSLSQLTDLLSILETTFDDLMF